MPIPFDDYWQRLRLIVDKGMICANQSTRNSRQGRSTQISELEPRILFSASPIDPSLMGDSDQAVMVAPVESAEQTESSETTTESIQQAQSTRDIIVIDSQVPDLQQLLDDITNSGRQSEVFVLDADRDGVDQISEILESHQDIESLHIVSHAENGSVRLGNTWLGDSNLDGYASQIASWQSSLTTDADILLYGCDLASEPGGQTLIDSISVLTGADVAASIDDTGHASFEANWVLEYSTGTIDTSTVFSEHLQSEWLGKLATITVTTFADEDNGDGVISLREAIRDASAGDTIDLGSIGAGTFSITIDTLELDEDLTITGLDARSTIIDATGLGKRVFEITGGHDVTMSQMTIQGGDENKGGGIFVSDGVLNLSDARLTGNSSDEGGAIHVHGTANLDRVLLDNNTSSGEGGAIHFHDADGGSLNNVTISGNTAGSDGGGIWTDSAITVTNSTITSNHGFQGGGVYKDGGAVDISNTIIAGNTADTDHVDVRGGFNSDGFNLIGVLHNATGFENDITGVNANLLALADNGGQTDTHALQSNSLAVNSGASLNAPNVDHRGVARNAIADIGAFELTTATTSKIYWGESGTGSIFRANADGTAVQEVLTNVGASRGLEVDVERGFIYWINETDGNRLYRSKLDGSGVSINSAIFANPMGLGLDLINNKVYVADSGSGTNDAIFEIDMDANTSTAIVSNFTGSIRDVAVDDSDGKIYISTDEGTPFSGQIFSFDLTGTDGLQTLVAGEAGPRSLEIDAANGKIYWADDGDFGVNRIRQANLADGSGKSSISTDGLDTPFGIDVNSNTGLVYWSDADSNFIRSQPLGGGATTDVIATGLSGPREIVVATVFGTNNAPTVVNPIADQTATQGTAFSFQFDETVFSDVDGDALTYSASLADGSTLPAWLMFTSSTRTFSGTPANGDVGTIAVRLTANDGNSGTAQDDFTLSVLNVNDAPTDITLSNSNVNENVDGGVIGTVSVQDSDASDTHTWSVSDSRFEITGTTLKLKSGQSLDKEAESTVDVTITVTDQGGTGFAYNEVFTITVDDVNESPTDITLSNSSVNENVDGATIGTVGVADPDSGDTHTLSVDDSRFEIVGTTLKLRAGQTLDRETEPTVNLTITATDQGGTGFAYNEVFTITVDNVNEAPTDITLSNTSVNENTAGATIGTVGVEDPDAGDTHTWSVDDARFEVVGAELRLRAGQSLDESTEPSVVVDITATDQSGAGLAYNEQFTVTVNAINDAPTVSVSGVTPSLSENANTTSSTKVADVTINDDALGTNTLALTGADASLFELKAFGTELHLKQNVTLDFETNPSLDVTIEVDDAAIGSSPDDSQSISITVTNANDAPTDIDLSNQSVTENGDGAIVGVLTVTDQDLGDVHTWSVDDTRFEVVGNQLKLKTGQSLDAESEPTVEIDITVTDQAGLGDQYTETFTITVGNVNEAPVSRDDSFTIPAGETLVGTTVLANDSDPESDALSVTEIVSASNGRLTLNADGTFSYTPRDGFFGTDVFVYSASDGTLSGNSAVVTIEVAFVAAPIPDSGPTREADDAAEETDDDGDEEESTSETGGGDLTLDPAGTADESDDRDSAPVPIERVDAADSTASDKKDEIVRLLDAISQMNGSSESSSVRTTQTNEVVNEVTKSVSDRSVTTSASIDHALMVSPGVMWNELDQQRQFVESQIKNDLVVMGVAGATASSFTVAILSVAMRTGLLASGLLAQMPAWKSLDPLLVMQGLGESGDAESLEEVMNRRIESLDNDENEQNA